MVFQARYAGVRIDIGRRYYILNQYHLEKKRNDLKVLLTISRGEYTNLYSP
jgi:hypothetical protein